VSAPRYALVAYVHGPVKEFVERLRRELHPELPHLAAHLTVLPPRPLNGSESQVLGVLEEVCQRQEPFDVDLGEVETFIPVTPTVFIRVAHAHSLLDLHKRLNATNALRSEEEWSYLPHLTIAKMSDEAQAQDAYLAARHRWTQFRGGRCIHVKELTFVREEQSNRWVDLAGVPLGQSLVSSRGR
jgi:2'-5' RNA ligase